MAKRLVKIAKELNVGTATIVEFLKKNGFNIENRPTAKVSEEMENSLIEEFRSSMRIKEKADQLNIRFNSPAKKEQKLTFEPPKIATPPTPISTPPPPITPPPLTVAEEPIQQKEEDETTPPPVKEEPKIEVKEETPPTKERKEPGLKVLGKINLDEVGKKKKPKKKTEEPKKEEPKVEVKKKEEEKTTPPPIKEEPKVEVKKKEEEKTPPPIKEEPKVEVKKKEETVIEKENEDIVAKAPQLEGLKIKGKINLEKFSPKPKTKTKSKQQQKNRHRKKKEDPNKKQQEQSSDQKKETQSNNTNNDAPKRRRKRKKVAKKTIEGNKRTDAGSRRKRGQKKEEAPEISKKEIEERIKATQARLQGGGKSNRQKVRRESRAKKREDREKRELENQDQRIQLTEFVSVSELASLMDVNPTEVIMTCMNLGYFVTLNQRLDAEIIEIVAGEFGHEVVFINAEEALEEEEEIVDDPKDLLPRAPIVTVMGHVDHGKTSLLDYVRKANVAEGEAGGITQHIGAYEVFVGDSKKKVTFLDTPGHEAFTAMRARGAKVTDVAVIIISADDKIMPQTKEAISHAQAAEVPMVFAINKIDKPGADPERIKGELAGMNLQVEDWGGKYQSQDISAKHGTNVEELLEKILLEAEILELKANPNRQAHGVVLEAALDKGRGYVAKILVQTGTLNVGDPIVSGEHAGKVKAMFNERGQRVKVAGPSTPVLILGLAGAPQAGEKFKAVETEQEAKTLANKRSIISREQANRANKRISLEEIGRRLALDSFKELNLIIKGDVDGSVEALADSLLKQSHETVQVNVIHKAVGQIIESDVLLASASDAIIVGFQVRPSAGARKLAEKEGVQIKSYSIIYKAIEEIRSAIEGMLEPTKEEKVVSEVEVREVYKINKVGTIAGCFVTEGKIQRNHKIRLIRNGIVTYPTKEGQVAELGSLKRFKDDVKEVARNMECGITIKNFNDIKVGDIIEAYDIVEIKQTLD